MKAQPRRWHLSSCGPRQAWAFTVCRGGKVIGLRRQCEHRHKMKMLFVFGAENKRCIESDLYAINSEAKQYDFLFFHFNQLRSDFDSLCLVVNELWGLIPSPKWSQGPTWVSEPQSTCGHWPLLWSGVECMPCLRRERIDCYQELFFAWGSAPQKPMPLSVPRAPLLPSTLLPPAFSSMCFQSQRKISPHLDALKRALAWSPQWLPSFLGATLFR